MIQTIHWSGMTHPGRFRKSNEDAFLGLIIYQNEAHYLGKEDEHAFNDGEYLFAVSDGMGGANAGDFASKIALQALTKRLPLGLQKAQPKTALERQQLVQNVFQDIDEEIINNGRFYEECRGMGATLSLCWVHAEGVTIGHVGDSRIYKIPKEKDIEQISEDHSYVGRLYREGKINEREAKSHPERHILDQALGGRTVSLNAQTEEIQVSPGDHLILCSDGICDGLYNRSIESTIVRPAPNIKDLRPSERLVKEALFSSGRDNLTSMVVRFS